MNLKKFIYMSMFIGLVACSNTSEEEATDVFDESPITSSLDVTKYRSHHDIVEALFKESIESDEEIEIIANNVQLRLEEIDELYARYEKYVSDKHNFFLSLENHVHSISDSSMKQTMVTKQSTFQAWEKNHVKKHERSVQKLLTERTQLLEAFTAFKTQVASKKMKAYLKGELMQNTELVKTINKTTSTKTILIDWIKNN